MPPLSALKFPKITATMILVEVKRSMDPKMAFRLNYAPSTRKVQPCYDESLLDERSNHKIEQLRSLYYELHDLNLNGVSLKLRKVGISY